MPFSTVPENGGRSLLLSTSLLISLSICSSHAMWPGKGGSPVDASFVPVAIAVALSAIAHRTFNLDNAAFTESPEQQGNQNQQRTTGEAAAQPNPGAASLDFLREMEASMTSLGIFENQESQGQEQVLEGATALDFNDGDSSPAGLSRHADPLEFRTEAEAFWQQSFNRLVAPPEDSVDGGSSAVVGRFDTFPGIDRVSPLLQSVSDYNALDSILSSFSYYSLIDLHYVLWRIAEHIGNRGLMRTLVFNANLLSRSFTQGLITFNQLPEDFFETEALLHNLDRLRTAVSISADEGQTTSQLLPDIVFNDLYNAIRLFALVQFRENVKNSEGGANISQLLVFIHHLSENAAYTLDGRNYIQGNVEAYARSRATFWLFHHFNEDRELSRNEDLELSRAGARYINAAYRSFTALYMAFMGQTSRAQEIFNNIACGEVAFRPGEPAQEVSSLVYQVVNGNMEMLRRLGLQDYRPSVFRSLYFLMRFPFTNQTPHTIVGSGSLDILRRIRSALACLHASNSTLFNFNEALVPHITEIDRFEQEVIKDIQTQQKNAQQALNEKPGSNEDRKHSKRRNTFKRGKSNRGPGQ